MSSQEKKTAAAPTAQPKTQKVLIMKEEDLIKFQAMLLEFPGKFCIPVQQVLSKHIKEVPVEE